MKTFKTVTETKQVVDKVICNKCEREMSTFFKDYLDIEHKCGYQTDFEDGDIYSFVLCESCLKEMFETFKIYPSKRNYTEYL